MYITLLKFLKVCYENIVILHHNIVSPNYYADHEKMAEYYELVAEISDSLVEHAIAIGIKEPTIEEALEDFKALEVKDYSKFECYTLVQDMFNELFEDMEQCKKEVPDYLKNLIEEYEAKLVIESKFKIAHLLNS